MMTKAKSTGNPTLAESDKLMMLFSQGEIVEAERLAVSLTHQFPKYGFGWKILGVIRQKQGLLAEAVKALQMAAMYTPSDGEVHYNLGNSFYDLQQLPEAVTSYQRAIKLLPDFAQAHYNLGSVFKDQGLLDKAEVSYKNALKIDQKSAMMHFNLAQLYYSQQRYSEAVNCYQNVLTIQPDHAVAQMSLGVVYKELGRLSDAESYYRLALKINPDYAEAYNNLGIMLKELGRDVEAEHCYRTAIKIKPDCVPAFNNLGILLKSTGKLEEAVSCYRKALSADPLNAVSHNNLGVALREQGRFAESESYCRKALKIRPTYTDAYNNLGLVLDSQGRFADAVSAFEKALECNPHDASVLSNFSVTLTTQGQLFKAEACLKKALDIDPRFVNLYINLCITYLAQGRPLEAEEICLRALEIEPDCLPAKSNLLFAMNYSAQHSVEDCWNQARQYQDMVASKVEKVFTSWHQSETVKRLRVGLVSADLRQHAVAYFLENVIRHIDTSKIELIAYSADGREDVVTARLKPYFSVWRSLVGLDDQSAAELIHGDDVHILLDLSGHSAGNRLPVFARKPAPVQASWLGYFATTGLNAMDYFIADEVGVPLENQHQFVEKIKYLPDTRLCFSVPDIAIEFSPLPALVNGHITFGCFQNMAKVGDDVLAIWGQVINALPNARLRLQNKALGDPDRARQVLERLKLAGIDSGKVTMHGFASREAYFAAHAEIDMILDTFPFNGGTTTCEALWMGVPTLTLAGSALISRQGVSLLTAAGLSDWVAETEHDFVHKALLFAGDIHQLARLRQGLRRQVLESPLFDGQQFARHMETALWQMWRDRQPILADVNEMNESSVEVHDQLLPKEAHNNNAISHSKHAIQIVSATRYSEHEFWHQSALGLSLQKHLKHDARLTVNVAFENLRGLSEVFNDSIDESDSEAILVFIHDDVWIDEVDFADTIIGGLEHFDVIGVAGNKRRVPKQPAWAFVDTQFTWDDRSNLSGQVAHGENAFGEMSDYGDTPAICELLDGVFIAARKSTLKSKNVRFDPQFDFHFYDMDFCRSARKSGLSLGTWPVRLTHQSGGAFGTPHWTKKYQQYLNKWETADIQNLALHDAMQEVFELATEHQQVGQTEQAEYLYHEILNIQPDHAGANHQLGVIEAQTMSASAALPRFERAVQVQPQQEQYWVSYIDALMLSGATESAVNALELGQQYGLKPETAQVLAVEFVRNIEAIQNISGQSEKLTKIHLGCGENYFEGWLNVDLDSPVADAHADFRNPLPYADMSVDFIFNEHFIEHITREEGLAFLKECRRVLKPGGVLRISTPDVRFLVEQYLSGKCDEWQDVGWVPESPCKLLNEGMRWWGHQFVYDLPELLKILSEAGFYNLVKVKRCESAHIELVGLECRPWHQELIVEAI